MVLTSDYQFIGRTTGVKAQTDSWYYYVLLYAKTAGDIATGKHTVSLKMRLVCDRNSSFYGFATAGSAAVDGAAAIAWDGQSNPSGAWNSNLTEGGITYPRWVDLAEGSVQVNTGYGAAKDVTLTASWQRKASTTTPPSYVPGTTTIAGSFVVTLPMIAGASTPTLSASTVEMEQPVTIYTNRLSAGFTHTLIGAFGGARELIAENVGDSCAWYPPVELARQIPGHTLGQGHIECYTYQNGVQIGSAQLVRIYLTVPASVVPTATMQWSDASGAMDRFGTLVQNVSRLAVSISGTGTYGSTIKSAAAYLDGAAYSGGVLTKSGAQTLRGTVTDSRGRSGSTSSTITVAAYAAPTVKVQASRCLEDGTLDDTGEFALVTITGSTTQVNGENTAALTFKHGSTTKEIPVEVGDFTHEEIVAAPSVSTLALSATLSDAILTFTDNMTLSVGYATMDFLKGGKGIAFGATATRDGFTCAMPAYFSGEMYRIAEDGEIEWLYPPMVPGVEYRTAERYENKSVYVKCLAQTFPNTVGSASSIADISIAHGVSGFSIFLRAVGSFSIKGSSTRFFLPYFNAEGGTVAIIDANTSNIVIRLSKAQYTYLTALVYVYYTKD